MVITVPIKKYGEEWRGAVVVDNKFRDAVIDPSLGSVVARAIGAELTDEYPDGTEIVLTLAFPERDDQSV